MPNRQDYSTGPVMIYEVGGDGSLIRRGPSQGGVSISLILDTVDILYDEDGTVPMGGVVAGLGGSLTIPMTAITWEKLLLAIPGAELQASPDGKLYIGNPVGANLSDYSIRILLKRIENGVETTEPFSTTAPNWVTVLKCAPVQIGNLVYGSEQQILEVTFQIYPDDSQLTPLGLSTLVVFGTPPGVTGGVLDYYDAARLVGPGGTPIVTAQMAYDTYQVVIQTNTIISGCTVAWTGVGLNFACYAGAYYIRGVRYTVANDTVTLSIGDVNFDRFDIIAVTTAGTWVVIEGSPSVDPQLPNVNPNTQLMVTFVRVNQGAFVPVITEEEIYLEDIEWTTNPTGVEFDPTDGVDPYAGAVAIRCTGGGSGDGIDFDRAVSIDLSPYDNLTMYMKSVAAWPAQKALEFRWYSGATGRGDWVAVDDGVYGWDSSDTSDYQLITIPLADFNFSNPNVDQLQCRITGGAANIDFYMDNIILQSGVPVVSAQNLWLTFAADAGSVAATTPTDTFLFSGGNLIETTISGKEMVIDYTIKHNFTAVANPTVNDDADDGYSVGSRWVNTATDSVFTCADSTVGAAVWTQGGLSGTIFDAKGDILTATADDTPVRKGVGSWDFGLQMLMHDSGQSDGLVWADDSLRSFLHGDVVKEDLYGDTMDARWAMFSGGTGSAAFQTAVEGGRILLYSGTNNGDHASWSWGNAATTYSQIHPAYECIMDALVYCISSNMVINVGLTEHSNQAINGNFDYVGFTAWNNVYGNTNWWARTTDRVVPATTTTDTGVVSQGAWTWLRFHHRPGGAASTKFYINGSLVATHTTNLPYSVLLKPTFNCYNFGGGATFSQMYTCGCYLRPFKSYDP